MSREQSAHPWDPFEGWSEEQKQLPMLASDMADVLGVKQSTFSLWARNGNVPAFRVGKRWFCTPSAVMTHLARPLGEYGRGRWDESVVYSDLETKVRGTSRRLDLSLSTPGPKPGLVEPQPAVLPEVDTGASAGALLSAGQLAEVFGVSVVFIYRLTKSGSIPSFKFGSTYRYDLEAVKAATATPGQTGSQPNRYQQEPSWAQPRRSLARRRVTD